MKNLSASLWRETVACVRASRRTLAIAGDRHPAALEQRPPEEQLLGHAEQDVHRTRTLEALTVA
jgi:hypothetical protein